MKNLSLTLVAFISFQLMSAQELTGIQLLEKAIQYHDPNDNWPSFNGELLVTMQTPKTTNRESKIVINLPSEIFNLQAQRDTITTEYSLDKTECSIKLNGSAAISEEHISTYNLNCDRAKMYKNYYTYLYGLPMKLKDKGTIIHKDVDRKTFKGKEYLVLKVTYDEGIGNDVWYFYFDPSTYAMHVYQFFKTDENGKEKKDTGEYILLSEAAQINGIAMPRVRAWYYNKDDTYLGTDTLANN